MSLAFLILAGSALAQEVYQEPYFGQHSWRDADYYPVASEASSDDLVSQLNEIEAAAGDATRDAEIPETKKSFSDESSGFDENEIVQKVMDFVPYSSNMKSAWDYYDGETDLYFVGMRYDRGNSGLSYTTNEVPFVGAVEGLKFKAALGDEQKVSIRYKMTFP